MNSNDGGTYDGLVKRFGGGVGGEVLFGAVLESLSEGVMVTDLTDRILYVNSVFQELSGYSEEELIGATGYKVLCPPEIWEEMRLRNQSRGTGASEEYELEQFRKDGTRQWVSIRATPLRDCDGKFVGTVGAVSCIEAQKGLERENAYLQEEILEAFNACDIVGESPVIAKVMDQARLVAPTDASVLILGESGTGKELVARAIHGMSARKDKPLVRVNCASIPKDLFESEFFGHVKGAFTGAVRDRAGRFALAAGGTLFLDEVGEIPVDLQGKLLRVLQEGQFERVGDEQTRDVDVRVIAATNRDLLDEGGRGGFRDDLYYRLSVFNIEMPPLRARGDDIVLLARHFIARSAERLRLAPPRLGHEDLKRLRSYSWPGNVRELQNVVERAVIVSRGGRIRLDMGAGGDALSFSREETGEGAGGVHVESLGLEDLVRFEEQIVRSALVRCRWKVYGADGAAAELGIKPTTLASKMKKFGLSKPGSRRRSRAVEEAATEMEIGVDD